MIIKSALFVSLLFFAYLELDTVPPFPRMLFFLIPHIGAYGTNPVETVQSLKHIVLFVDLLELSGISETSRENEQITFY